MPLTPLPEDNTRRFFINWLVGSQQHTTMVRVSSTPSSAAILADLQNQFLLLQDSMGNNVSIIGVDEAAAGSNVRNPVAGWTQIDGTATNDPVSGQHLSRTFSYRGRSVTGRKTKGLLWGLVLAENDDFQMTPTAGTDLATFVANLDELSFEFLAIDGTKPTFKNDLLEDYNDHWEKELRP